MQLDQHLVSKMQQGDVRSLKSVVKASIYSLYRISFKVTGDSDKSKAILAKVYKQIWEHRADLDPYRQLGPLLMREVFVQSQKEQKEPNLQPSLDLLKEEGDAKTQFVAQNISTTNKMDTLLFLMYFVDGLDFRDLANVTKLEETEVENRVGSVMSSLAGITS